MEEYYAWTEAGQSTYVAFAVTEKGNLCDFPRYISGPPRGCEAAGCEGASHTQGVYCDSLAIDLEEDDKLTKWVTIIKLKSIKKDKKNGKVLFQDENKKQFWAAEEDIGVFRNSWVIL